MVKITFFQDQKQRLTGFECRDHAEFADENDIVCAAVSALVINCMNSVEMLTDARFVSDICEADARIEFHLEDEESEDAQLLLKSLALGLEEMERNNEEYIDVIFEEV